MAKKEGSTEGSDGSNEKGHHAVSISASTPGGPGGACGGLSAQLNSAAAVRVTGAIESRCSVAAEASVYSPRSFASQVLGSAGKVQDADENMGKKGKDQHDRYTKYEGDLSGSGEAAKEKKEKDSKGGKEGKDRDSKGEKERKDKGSEGGVSADRTSNAREPPIDVVCHLVEQPKESARSEVSAQSIEKGASQILDDRLALPSRRSAPLDVTCRGDNEHVEVNAERQIVQHYPIGSAVPLKTVTTAPNAESILDVIEKQHVPPAVLGASKEQPEEEIRPTVFIQRGGDELEDSKAGKHESPKAPAKGTGKSETKKEKKRRAKAKKKSSSSSDSSSDFCLTDSDVSPSQSSHSGAPSDSTNGTLFSRCIPAHAPADKELRSPVRFGESHDPAHRMLRHGRRIEALRIRTTIYCARMRIEQPLQYTVAFAGWS